MEAAGRVAYLAYEQTLTAICGKIFHTRGPAIHIEGNSGMAAPSFRGSEAP